MEQKIDVLNREPFIEKLMAVVQLLSINKQGCCFGINGAWGSGKSFVLEKFENRLREMISEETADNRYYVFHYNCWKYDYYEEPAVAIVSSMLDEVTKEFELLPKSANKALILSWKTAKNTMTEIAREICTNKVGIDLVAIAEKTLQEHDEQKIDSFDELYGFNRALEKTREKIQKIAENKTMIIVVDELDRCLPEYAIKVLERLHHLFVDLDNVIVIVSMDKKQLEHSIKGIYGDIEVDDYLRKFITFEVDLDNGKVSDYAGKYRSYFEMFSMTEGDLALIERFLGDIFVNMPIRTQERIFRKAEIIHQMIKFNDIEDSSILAFEILFLTVALKTKSNDLRWINLIRKQANSGKRDALGGGYYTMLNKWLDESVRGVYQCSLGKFDHVYGLIGKAFFLIIAVHNDYYGGRCGNYYCEAVTEEMISSVKKFAELVGIIESD